ncbi:exported hypothetical protein [Rhizobium mesoamericanum STM3625]|uniref:Alcohol dehydrogenase-like C-terminal domain-containing protein n=2 Tax=Rhizobium mesoamericanum TaxID=1079800 RepID=K0PYD6_9HYPH|nr:exported hypothetical protein [Rhizobium mesoamericanum STM3625]
MRRRCPLAASAASTCPKPLALGGVGSFAIQFARAAGARVITTASGDGITIADEALAKAHGVSAAFVFHSSDARRLAAVIDKVAGGVQVLIDRVIDLNDGSAGFARQASGRARGKIIVSPEAANSRMVP